jgi:dipeptidyl-peptidase 4
MRRIFLLFLVLIYAESLWAQVSKKDITLEDIWKKGTFRMKSVPGFNAMKDGKRYTQIDVEKGQQSIGIYNLQKGTKEGLVFDNWKHTIHGDTLSIADYRFSEDEQTMLILCEPENIYRRSVMYKAYYFDVKSGALIQVDSEKILHPSFNHAGNKIAFVKDNNLFIKDIRNGLLIQVTKDGERNQIINGNCDWVYEEEFEFTQAFQWSPKGNYLAYYRFDESNVPQYTMTVYDKLYPTPYQYKYPKAGEKNSEVSIHIYDVQQENSFSANIGAEKDQYIPRIKWTNNDQQLCIYRLNRLQNKLDLLLVNAQNKERTIIYTESNEAYVEINDNLEFLPDNESFIFNSERNGYNHLYRYNWEEEQLRPLTKGKFDIESIVGIDKKAGLVYYTAAKKSALERKLYVMDFEGKNQHCISPEAGTHNITPCEGFQYFLDKHSTLNDVPVFYLRNAMGKIVRSLEDNKALKNKMNEYNLGTIQFTQIMGLQEKLNAWMITPPNFDSTKKYPVLMYQYSGPGSQMVADKFPVGDYFWHQMLASKGYIIFCVDGTGTGFRGEAFKKKTYLQLGKYESDDQIAVAQNLAKLPFVDGKRIGIWGWSFGGFMSSTCMFKGGDVFRAGIAVAPVTNWRYYDNIYTERYMRRPQENAKGYDDNAPEKMVEGLKGKFLLVHGTADDNVHFQNAVMMSEQLIQKNKAFEDAYYPNKNHGISGGNTRLHLYHKMTEFILKNL